jgi:cytosine/adenosine deaminase-related metal-dependent hydrolase
VTEKTTLIENGTIVAFDGNEHRILKNGHLAFKDDRIIYVGRNFEGQPDERIDATGMLVTPGFVSTHCHLRLNEGYRMVIDGGRRDFVRSGFTNYGGPTEGKGRHFLQGQDVAVAVSFAMMSLLRFGVTTIVELDNGGNDHGETVVRLAGESGIRVYYSPYVTSSSYQFTRDGIFQQVWSKDEGLPDIDKAAGFIEKNDGAHNGRVRGMFVLNEFYGATPALRKATIARARDMGVRMTMHFSEQVMEFHDTLRKYAMTPVEVLASEGLLGPDLILGHCKFVSGSSVVSYPFEGDLELLADSGSHVAHSPVAYARRGSALESFQRYLDAGISMTLGTDSMPHDMIREMGMAAVANKMIEKNNESARAGDVFNAATLGGARALGRDDLGRLSAGAKADILLIDFDNLTIGPVLDPIRMLVHAGDGMMVDTTIVDGVTRVKGGKPLFWDEAKVKADAREAAAKTWAGFSEFHWAGKQLEEVFPPSFSEWK